MLTVLYIFAILLNSFQYETWESIIRLFCGQENKRETFPDFILEKIFFDNVDVFNDNIDCESWISVTSLSTNNAKSS